MTIAWPDSIRATRLRLALWPFYLLAAEPSYRRLWLLTLGAGTAAFAARIAFLIAVTDAGRFGLGPPQYVLYEGLAAFAVAPLSGVLVDWCSPRQVLVWVEAIRSAALAAFALVGAPLLLLLIMLLGGCAVVHQAAHDACLLDTLPARRVTRASGLDQAASWCAIIAGPLLGTALIYIFDLTTIAALLALAHLLLLRLAWRLPQRRREAPRAETRGLLPRLTLLRIGGRVFAVFACGALAGSVWIAVAPQMIAHVWQAEPGWFGVQVTVAGVTAIAGSLAAPSLIARVGSVPAMVWLAGAEALALAAYALCPTLTMATITVGVIGVIAGAFLTAFYAYLQRSAEAQERGRLFALVRQLDAAALLLAGVIASLLMGHLPPWQILGLTALLYLASVLAYAARQWRAATPAECRS